MNFLLMFNVKNYTLNKMNKKNSLITDIICKSTIESLFGVSVDGHGY
jgi:hypothetical protein